MAGVAMGELRVSYVTGGGPDRPWEEAIAAPGRKTARRRRLWELRADYHCSICGTCLNHSDLKRVAGKAGFRVDPSASEYEVHGTFVRFASEPGRVAKAMQKLLDRKHRSAIERCRAMGAEAELRAFWAASLAKGDVSGPYWALMTHPLASERLMVDLFGDVHMLSHPLASERLMVDLFGDVHMLSHLLGASNRADIRRLNFLEREREVLSEALAGSRRQLAEKDAQLRRLRDERDRAAESARATETRLAAAKARVNELTAGGALQALEVRNEALAARAEKASRDHQVECRRRAELEREVSELRSSREDALIELRDLGAECEALELMVGSRIPGEVPAVADRSPSLDLGGRRIAYVGGRANLIGHFRDLIEQSNGELIHHDGGVDDSTGRLGRILGQADAVLCPVDCVSHGACLLAKQFCKRRQKPFVPLRSAGLSSFVGGLRQVAEHGRDGGSGYRPLAR